MSTGENSNVNSNKCVCKTIMALNKNQKQATTIKSQSASIIEKVHKGFNYILRSFDLEKNHETLEGQEDNPFDYSLQSTK
jgi:hypothetical protein